MKNKQNEKKMAGMVKRMAEFAARNGVNKKLIIMLYEPEVPEAVKEFIKKEEK